MFAVRVKTIDYVLNDDRAESVDKQPVFQIKTLTVSDQDRISDLEKWERDGKGEIVLLSNANEITTETVRVGLVGWKNFRFDDGTECPFDSDMDKNLLALSPMVRFELRIAIRDLSYPTQVELKNSNSPHGGRSVTTKKKAKREQ